MPSQTGGYFDRSLTYLCEHNADGAMGLIVNRPTTRNLTDLLIELAVTATTDDILAEPLFDGGPVSPQQAFVLHSQDAQLNQSLPVGENTFLSASPEVLQRIATNQGPEDYLVTLGYAGWGPGQLEYELAENAWICLPADPDQLIKVPPAQRLDAVSRAAGVDLNLLGGRIGHD